MFPVSGEKERGLFYNMASFIQRIKPLERSLNRRRVSAWKGWSIVCAGLFLAVLELLDKVFVFKESSAVIWVLLLLTFMGSSILYGIFRVRKSPRKLSDLATAIEEEHPELMDGLHAAVEVANKAPADRTLLDRLLIEDVSKKTAAFDFDKTLIPVRLRLLSITSLWVLGFALLVAAHFYDVSQKFRYAISDLVAGEFTGFEISPDPLEAPRGSDFKVSIRPTRWDSGVKITYEEEGEPVVYPLGMSGDGTFDFVFYDVREDFEFSVETQSLSSPTYKVVAYDPPALDDLLLEISPPNYSGYPAISLNELEDVEILEGALLSFSLVGKSIDQLFIEFEEDSVELQQDDLGIYAFEMRPSESDTIRFVMKGPSGHRAQTQTIQMTVLPDERPVVEWVAPGKDMTAKPTDVIPLELFAADDFGLSAVILNVSISGTRQSSFSMHEKEEGREPGSIELTLYEALDLNELEVLDGDVISYSATAMDNREPEPNIVRSEVFFIEVRVEKEPIEVPAQDGEEQEKIDVRALVIELKRIIRDTYLALGMMTEDQIFANQEIGTDLASLRGTIEEVMVRAAPLLTAQGQEHLMEFLIRSREAMETAETMVNNNATSLAISPEEKALAELVSFEAELSRNQPKPSDESSEVESESDSESEGEAQGEGQSQPKEREFADLPKALDQLNSLIDEQNEMNEEVARAERRDADQATLNELAEKQQQLSSDAVEMRDYLEELLPGNPSSPMVDNAAVEMGKAGQQLTEGEAGLASRSGGRAKENLMGAASLLEESINQIASEIMQGLAQQGQQLAQAQSQAAGQSKQAQQGELSAEEQEQLKGEQQQINQAYDDWQERMAEAANQLREKYPDASGALDDIREQAEDENLEGQMSRAENALNYERFRRAAPIQEGLAQSLDHLSEGVAEAAGQMPQLADAAVAQALEQLQRARQALQEMQAQGEGEEGQEALEGMKSEIASGLGSLASQMDSDELRELAQQLAPNGNPPEWSGNLRATDKLLGEAGQLLMNHLQAAVREMQLDMLRQSSDPPEQYRKQVEKYFEKLAEEGGRS